MGRQAAPGLRIAFEVADAEQVTRRLEELDETLSQKVARSYTPEAQPT